MAHAVAVVRPLEQSVHALFWTYLGAAHAVASMPSQVWPLGQFLHALSEMYSVVPVGATDSKYNMPLAEILPHRSRGEGTMGTPRF